MSDHGKTTEPRETPDWATSHLRVVTVVVREDRALVWTAAAQLAGFESLSCWLSDLADRAARPG